MNLEDSQRPLPQQLTLYVNYACNLRCRHCYLYGVADVERSYMTTNKASAMSWEVFTRSVDPLIEAGNPLTVFLMGGEPCLHTNLPAMISYIKKASTSYVDMNTNGMFLDRCADDLIEAGIDAIYVSLDGSSEEKNDALRGTGSFAASIAGIRHLKQSIAHRNAPTKVALNYTITNRNFTDLLDMARLAEELEIDELFFNLPSFVHKHEGLEAQRVLSEKLAIEFNSWRGFQIDSEVAGIPPDELEAIISGLNGDWPFDLYLQPVEYSPQELATYFQPSWEQQAKKRTCQVLSFRTTVLPNGDVTPCTIYPDVVVGNVLETGMSEVWHGQKYEDFRNEIAQNLLPTCMRCCDLFDETNGDPSSFVSGSREGLAVRA
ncbi:radical SAM protein [Parerythrobacter aestuarii]|uniref:radical SAM protein n=1 Tax=Parerythrobacter aestuarii TaxID=3020909 RepID=UPI0024DE898F|nr:radical SAM protein [Parerythrobacter aestuarii]